MTYAKGNIEFSGSEVSLSRRKTRNNSSKKCLSSEQGRFLIMARRDDLVKKNTRIFFFFQYTDSRPTFRLPAPSGNKVVVKNEFFFIPFPGQAIDVLVVDDSDFESDGDQKEKTLVAEGKPPRSSSKTKKGTHANVKKEDEGL